MASSSPLARISSNITQELEDSSVNIAAKMKSEIVDPQDVQSKQEFLDYVDRQWDDPKFREDLHQQVGDQHLISIAQDVLKKRADASVAANQPSTVGSAAKSAGQIASLTPPIPPVTPIPLGAPPLGPGPTVPPPMMPPPPPPQGIAGLPPGVPPPNIPQ